MRMHKAFGLHFYNFLLAVEETHVEGVCLKYLQCLKIMTSLLSSRGCLNLISLKY